jgi:Fe/S biogenesis protein NfuA
MLTFTDRAKDVVRSFLDQSGGELEALRITSQSGSPVAPRFELTLVGLDERSAEEEQLDAGGFPVLVRESEMARLDGATVDYVERVNESGFEVRPAAQAGPAPVRSEPEGELADKVREVLESQVNPAIAAHGGVITLVDLDDTEVYVEMGGGCQGCALSRMTLRQGVERMLREAIPELTAVHDVTDHDSGQNPYFSQ